MCLVVQSYLFAVALLSMEFPRQEYWSGLPFPPPGDLPDPGIKPTFLMSCGKTQTNLLTNPIHRILP